jgi:hypothetical protein
MMISEIQRVCQDGEEMAHLVRSLTDWESVTSKQSMRASIAACNDGFVGREHDDPFQSLSMQLAYCVTRICHGSVLYNRHERSSP